MVDRKKLTRKQEEFVRHYLVDLNAAAAYRRAGYTARGNSAEVSAARLLRNAQVAAAVEKAMSERAARIEVSADRVVRELAKIAFLDIRRVFNDDGAVKQPNQFDDDTVAAIAGIEVSEMRDGDGAVVGFAKKIKIADKLRALELLGKHLGMFRERVEVSGDDQNPLTLLIRQVQGSAFKPVPMRVVDHVSSET